MGNGRKTIGGVHELHLLMLDAIGQQETWWPAASAFDRLVGAFLVQNTQWGNVELSLANLRAADALTPEALASLPLDRLMELIRPSGMYRQKARALAAVSRWLLDRRGADSGARDPRDAASAGASAGLSWIGPPLVEGIAATALRTELLELPGVGRETADVLMVYIFDRPAFIADAYARRIFTRLGTTPPKAYDAFAALATDDLAARGHPLDAPNAQELHGLIVDFGKLYVRSDAAWEAGPLSGRRLELATP